MGQPGSALSPGRLKALALALWGVALLQSALSGRLDLLLRAVFHPLVWGSGILLLLLAAVEISGRWRDGSRASGRWTSLLSIGAALAVLALPPRPSFADLAANRQANLLEEPGLSFVLPPAQRSLTDWVRLLRAEPDPRLYAGDPVRISGFVLPMPGEEPHLARLLVRCCLVDAVPVGLPVRWPAGQPSPRADQWLLLEGVMVSESVGGRQRSVVEARRVEPIPRPRQPLEP
ncbi:TIGR03943 family putative permease subunit [Synechococcus sp. EJ6-Ellesmere]|uniref:TIGR03943 family putative permease subunit n=1 Tax=Synechococcus sp. EJ6-Ellesmere TaxID=2823734 RepID=UPI0020CDCFDE|nr:TIGR03943 family protein [Synechococcus sp. EJ6-Ellesmere]MCP9825545.1 TIGR03943 family protein [Synechococcus sp. EJ6-Ellesmere]